MGLLLNFVVVHPYQKRTCRGVGIAYFNLATPGGNTLEVRPLIAYVLLQNDLKQNPFKLFKEGCKAALGRLFNFVPLIQASFEFFLCQKCWFI